MITKMYNEMGQPIKYKGQLCLGDIIYFAKTHDFGGYKVIKLEENTGIVKYTELGDEFPVSFTKVGWGYVTR